MGCELMGTVLSQSKRYKYKWVLHVALPKIRPNVFCTAHDLRFPGIIKQSSALQRAQTGPCRRYLWLRTAAGGQPLQLL